MPVRRTGRSPTRFRRWLAHLCPDEPSVAFGDSPSEFVQSDVAVDGLPLADGDHSLVDSVVVRKVEHGHETVDVVGSEADVEADSAGNATAEQAREERGPPTDVPEPVPGFVSQLYQQIVDHPSGDLSGAEFGEAIAVLTPDEADTEGTEQNEENADA